MDGSELKGKRCRVLKFLTSAAGRVDRFSEGRIRYSMENLGRLLVLVDWDVGGSTVVFPDEVEILETA
jgi:hypothetical protein